MNELLLNFSLSNVLSNTLNTKSGLNFNDHFFSFNNNLEDSPHSIINAIKDINEIVKNSKGNSIKSYIRAVLKVKKYLDHKSPIVQKRAAYAIAKIVIDVAKLIMNAIKVDPDFFTINKDDLMDLMKTIQLVAGHPTIQANPILCSLMKDVLKFLTQAIYEAQITSHKEIIKKIQKQNNKLNDYFNKPIEKIKNGLEKAMQTLQGNINESQYGQILKTSLIGEF